MTEEDKQPQTVEDLIRNLGTSMNEGFQALGMRIGRLEPRLDELEAWRKKTSLRVGAIDANTSSADLSHESKLAAEITARAALEKKVDAIDTKQNTQIALLTRIESLTSNPVVRQIFTMIGAGIVAWLASKGLK